jgi:hypothetical protein
MLLLPEKMRRINAHARRGGGQQEVLALRLERAPGIYWMQTRMGWTRKRDIVNDDYEVGT